MIRSLFLLVFGFASLWIHAADQSSSLSKFDEAKALYDDQNYEAAFILTAELSGTGDTDALNLLGDMYFYGRGVTKSHEEAALKWRQAADNGNAAAQASLGASYQYGEGVPQDDELAVYWYQQSADQGMAIAQRNLGNMYDIGKGVEQDFEEAVRWYRLASSQGFARAHYDLALNYYNGEGVEQSIDQTIRYMETAAQSGYGRARTWLNDYRTEQQQAAQLAAPKQTISDLTCRAHKNRMDMALRWRAQDMPVSYVEDALFDFDAEDDIRTLRFLRAALRQIYADPETGREYLNSGRFEDDCVKIHRGY